MSPSGIVWPSRNTALGLCNPPTRTIYMRQLMSFVRILKNVWPNYSIFHNHQHLYVLTVSPSVNSPSQSVDSSFFPPTMGTQPNGTKINKWPICGEQERSGCSWVYWNPGPLYNIRRRDAPWSEEIFVFTCLQPQRTSNTSSVEKPGIWRTIVWYQNFESHCRWREIRTLEGGVAYLCCKTAGRCRYWWRIIARGSYVASSVAIARSTPSWYCVFSYI